jgi:hypothetical protein
VDLKSFDWRSLQKYLSAQSANDLNAFLEKLPALAGHTALYAAAVAWASGVSIGLFATIQAKKLTELRATLKETDALKPDVPIIHDVPVAQGDLKAFVAILASLYTDLRITQIGASINIAAPSTANFGEFREAIGHVQNGGNGWRVTVDRLCVGRECDKDKLTATLKVNKVSVDNPSK